MFIQLMHSLSLGLVKQPINQPSQARTCSQASKTCFIQGWGREERWLVSEEGFVLKPPYQRSYKFGNLRESDLSPWYLFLPLPPPPSKEPYDYGLSSFFFLPLKTCQNYVVGTKQGMNLGQPSNNKREWV